MCRFVYGSINGPSYLLNDDLVIISNLFVERVITFEKSNEVLFSDFSMAILIKEMFGSPDFEFLGKFVKVEKVMDNLLARIKESYELLKNETKFGKCLDLKSFALFYFSKGLWCRVKGKRVRKSPFGWWVTRKGITKIIEMNKFNEVLVSKMVES